MKIMKYIVPALLGGMLTLQSCEHFLDTKPTETYGTVANIRGLFL